MPTSTQPRDQVLTEVLREMTSKEICLDAQGLLPLVHHKRIISGYFGGKTFADKPAREIYENLLNTGGTVTITAMKSSGEKIISHWEMISGYNY